MSVDDETWTIEVTPQRFGWYAIAISGEYRLGGSMDGMGGLPIWRPTRAWAERAIERVVRQYFRSQAREQQRAARARVYRFKG